jgi:hypothetical protein
MAKLGDEIDKHVEEGVPYIENMADLSMLVKDGYFTVAQCAALMPAHLPHGKQGSRSEVFEPYYVLACLDIARSELIARHPDTRLPYSQYLRMMEAGVYGEAGDEMPIPTADWLVSLDDAEKWLNSKGLDINFDGLKADLDKLKHQDKSFPQPVANWKMRIQERAAMLWREHRKMGSPTKNNIKSDLARWCRENNVTSKHGIFPSEDYIYRHVLKDWKPPTG